MLLNGAEIVIEILKEQGVDTVFGYPGGTILNIYDELYRHGEEINHILTSHEQGAAHAADGYARATGKVGVCFATSGPGATNLVTGIATAYMDSIPMVAITCNVAKPLLGKDSFQEIDIAGVTMPITKHNFIVRTTECLADKLRRAFKIAQSGRPGPVLVDITKDATANCCEFEPMTPDPIERIAETIKAEALQEAAAIINKSKRPFFLVGGGAVISEASEEIIEFAHKLNAPVADSLMGKGAFPGTDELYTGMIGMHGTKVANFGIHQADVAVVIGARFSDRVVGNAKKFLPKAKIVQIDIDPAEINKNIMVHQAVIGDVKEVLKRLLPMVNERPRDEWNDRIKELQEKYPLTYDQSTLTGPYIIEEIYRITNGEAIITTDVGQHQMWAAQYYKYTKPHTLLTSGGLGTMGYGLGACIGAKVACPDKTVINIGGDGCFRMNLQELATASRYNIPIIQVVINNHVLGMVRQWQTLFYGKRYSQTILNDKVDFVKVAEGLGCMAIRVTKREEVAPALEAAMAADGPVVIECIIDSDDKVFPMVPAGAPIVEAFDAEDLKNQE